MDGVGSIDDVTRGDKELCSETLRVKAMPPTTTLPPQTDIHTHTHTETYLRTYLAHGIHHWRYAVLLSVLPYAQTHAQRACIYRL